MRGVTSNWWYLSISGYRFKLWSLGPHTPTRGNFPLARADRCSAGRRSCLSVSPFSKWRTAHGVEHRKEFWSDYPGQYLTIFTNSSGLAGENYPILRSQGLGSSACRIVGGYLKQQGKPQGMGFGGRLASHIIEAIAIRRPGSTGGWGIRSSFLCARLFMCLLLKVHA